MVTELSLCHPPLISCCFLLRHSRSLSQISLLFWAVMFFMACSRSSFCLAKNSCSCQKTSSATMSHSAAAWRVPELSWAFQSQSLQQEGFLILLHISQSWNWGGSSLGLTMVCFFWVKSSIFVFRFPLRCCRGSFSTSFLTCGEEKIKFPCRSL